MVYDPETSTFFGLHTLSHAAKELHFSPCSVFFVQRHFLLNLSSNSSIVGGNHSSQSAKIVNEEITVFSSESLEPYDIIDSVEVSLLSMLQTIGIRSWIEGLDVPRGSPRYMKGIFPIVQPTICAISLLKSSSQFIGIKVDL